MPRTGPMSPQGKNSGPPKPSTADRARARVQQVRDARTAAVSEVRKQNKIATTSDDPAAARKARMARQAAADRAHQLAKGEASWRNKAQRMGWKPSELAGGANPKPDSPNPPPISTPKGSGNAGGGSSAGGAKTVPTKPITPSLKRDKQTANKGTVLKKALAMYGDPKGDPRRTGEMVQPGTPYSTDLHNAEFKKFKKGYLKDHKSAKNLSNESLNMIARMMKHKGSTGWKKYGA